MTILVSLAESVAGAKEASAHPIVVGISGSGGSGKANLAAALTKAVA